MRIIFINRLFHPDHSATAQVLADVAFGLAARGFAVQVLASRQRYDDPRAALPRREHVQGVDVVRLGGTRFGRMRLAGRALDALVFAARAAWWVLRHARAGDVVVVLTDPPLLAVPVTVAARVRRARVVHWLHDLFPEVAQALNVPGMRLLGPPLRAVRDWALRRGARAVVLAPAMAARVAARGVSARRIAVIPNWADGTTLACTPGAGARLRAQWELGERFVVGYSGNLGRAHEVDVFVRAAALLYATAPDVVLLFIGGGAGYAALRQAAHAQGLPNVQFRPYQPRAALGESLAVADVHLVSLLPAMEGLVVPSKYYGILAAGRPVIVLGDPAGDLARQTREAQCGMTVATADAPGLVRAVLALRAAPSERAQMGALGRALFEAQYDLPHALARWSTLLQGV